MQNRVGVQIGEALCNLLPRLAREAVGRSVGIALHHRRQIVSVHPLCAGQRLSKKKCKKNCEKNAQDFLPTLHQGPMAALLAHAQEARNVDVRKTLQLSHLIGPGRKQKVVVVSLQPRLLDGHLLSIVPAAKHDSER
jgi:hypothetical protein